ncbi:MAG: sugar ABC transporter permease [Candidatus Rokubacteria bacterium]|nr:sugar ABC transporter permease [Candidatus Rokubacteria bacterium]
MLACGASRRRVAVAFLAPALVVLVVVTLGPLLYLVATSLTPLDLTRPHSFRFVGLENYHNLVTDDRFWNSVMVQFKLSTATVIAQLALGLGLAVLLNRPLPFRELIRTGFIVPMVLPPIVVAIIWKILFTPLLTPMSLLTSPLRLTQPSWLTDPRLALWTIAAADVWEWTPFTTLLLVAALQMMPQEPLEAARVDGASAWQRFVWIVLPLLRPALIVAGLFRLIDSFKAFPLIFVMTGGGPGVSTEPTNYYAYTQAFTHTFIGYSSAMIVVMLVITMALSAAVMRLPGLKPDVE